MKIILASNSARRKELLTKHNIEFDCIPSNIEENVLSNFSVVENVMNLAKIKCEDIVKKYPERVVLAADTIVAFNNKIYGKPIDEKDALKMLLELQGNTHEVITAVAVYKDGNYDVEYEVSKVTFRTASECELMEYIDTKEPMDKAGSYAIQGIGSKFIEKYEGEFDNIVGLPMKLVLKMI